MEHFYGLLLPIVTMVAVFTFVTVATWAENRRKERESYYREETYRKIVEHGEHDRPARADIRRIIADPGRAANELGWCAGTSLRQGLLATIRHVSETEHETGVGGTA